MSSSPYLNELAELARAMQRVSTMRAPTVHPRAFTGRHVALLAILVIIGVLIRADEAVPLVFRVPGMLVLAAIAIVLLVRRPHATR